MDSVCEKMKKLTRWRKKKSSVTITHVDPVIKVIYLGNVHTGWAKGEGCLEKPLATLWKNYCQSNKSNVVMRLAVCSSGLQATTLEHGLTEYWSHRVTWYAAPPSYPKIFAWIYRHEGRRLKQELRCHAVLCSTSRQADQLSLGLGQRLREALHDFRREKLCRQSARLSLASCLYDDYSESIPRRKLLLAPGINNYRPPVEHSKSAPKLGSIEEAPELEEVEEREWLRVLALRYQPQPILESLGDEIQSEESEESSAESFIPESETVTDHITEDSGEIPAESEDFYQEFSLRLEVDSAIGTVENDSLGESPCSSSENSPFLREKVRFIIKMQPNSEDIDTVSDESGYSEEKEVSSTSGSDEESLTLLTSKPCQLFPHSFVMNQEFTLNL